MSKKCANNELLTTPGVGIKILASVAVEFLLKVYDESIGDETESVDVTLTLPKGMFGAIKEAARKYFGVVSTCKNPSCSPRHPENEQAALNNILSFAIDTALKVVFEREILSSPGLDINTIAVNSLDDLPEDAPEEIRELVKSLFGTKGGDKRTCH